MQYIFGVHWATDNKLKIVYVYPSTRYIYTLIIEGCTHSIPTTHEHQTLWPYTGIVLSRVQMCGIGSWHKLEHRTKPPGKHAVVHTLCRCKQCRGWELGTALPCTFNPLPMHIYMYLVQPLWISGYTSSLSITQMMPKMLSVPKSMPKEYFLCPYH